MMLTDAAMNEGMECGYCCCWGSRRRTRRTSRGNALCSSSLPFLSFFPIIIIPHRHHTRFPLYQESSSWTPVDTFFGTRTTTTQHPPQVSQSVSQTIISSPCVVWVQQMYRWCCCWRYWWLLWLCCLVLFLPGRKKQITLRHSCWRRIHPSSLPQYKDWNLTCVSGRESERLGKESSGLRAIPGTVHHSCRLLCLFLRDHDHLMQWKRVVESRLSSPPPPQAAGRTHPASPPTTCQCHSCTWVPASSLFCQTDASPHFLLICVVGWWLGGSVSGGTILLTSSRSPPLSPLCPFSLLFSFLLFSLGWFVVAAPGIIGGHLSILLATNPLSCCCKIEPYPSSSAAVFQLLFHFLFCGSFVGLLRFLRLNLYLAVSHNHLLPIPI